MSIDIGHRHFINCKNKTFTMFTTPWYIYIMMFNIAENKNILPYIIIILTANFSSRKNGMLQWPSKLWPNEL